MNKELKDILEFIKIVKDRMEKLVKQQQELENAANDFYDNELFDENGMFVN